MLHDVPICKNYSQPEVLLISALIEAPGNAVQEVRYGDSAERWRANSCETRGPESTDLCFVKQLLCL
jgi:hypothetical protein